MHDHDDTASSEPGEGVREIRDALGRGAAYWCRSGGHELDEVGWRALSGARNLAYNVVLRHDGGPDALQGALELIVRENAPGTIMVAGPALGSVQTLADAGWVCIGSTPIMHRRREGFVAPASREGVRRATHDVLGAVRRLLAETFALDDATVECAAPDDLISRGALWVAEVEGRVVSCLIAVAVGPVATLWSMATETSFQGRGVGRRLLTSVIATLVEEGAESFTMLSSGVGLSLYESLGFTTLEHWQLWSRPRWALGRS